MLLLLKYAPKKRHDKVKIHPTKDKKTPAQNAVDIADVVADLVMDTIQRQNTREDKISRKSLQQLLPLRDIYMYSL